MYKSILTVAIVAVTVLSFGFVGIVPARAAYVPTEGDIIKIATNPAVYYIGADKKRHLYPNEVTFWTWHTGTWSNIKSGTTTKVVKVVSQSDFDLIEAGVNSTARPGSKLVKFDNSEHIYMVTDPATLARVNTAEATQLFGADWQKQVIVIQSGFEVNYSKNGQLIIDVDETVGWQTYTNAQYGITFSYPGNFQVITNKIQQEYINHPNGFNWYRIELTDASASEKPFFRLEIDPDGYGPFFPDKNYQVIESNAGGVVVNSVSNSSSENSNDGKVLIIPNTLQASNGHSYYWQFSYNESGKDYEPLLKEILATLRFTK
jgi:hypothetical protein